MLTELSRSIFLAIVSGFICGLSQSVLENIFRVKIDGQTRKSIKLTLMIGLLTGLCTGIFCGLMTFTLAHWSNTITSTNLNRFAIFVPLSFPLSVITARILPLHLIFPYVFSRNNKANN